MPAGAQSAPQAVDANLNDPPQQRYLRKIDGVLRLRGYRSDHENVWSPDDRLVFARLHNAARRVRVPPP